MANKKLKSSVHKAELKGYLLECCDLCWYCGEKLTREKATIEHILPKNTHPLEKHNAWNMTLACYPCNQARSDKPIEDYCIKEVK